MRKLLLACIMLALLCLGACAQPQRGDLPTRAQTALSKAVTYFTRNIACHGGYLWWYSQDLTERAGEREATPTQVWVQPPGTPSVGFAYLRAYEATDDRQYLEAAKAAAASLAWGQLESGGWDYRIDFDPEESKRWYYRRDKGNISAEGAAKRRNASTFDDNTSQHALRLVMAVDDVTGHEPRYHEAVEYGLAFFRRAQFPNGAWPQRYPLSEKGYSRQYTFNDNAINDCIDVMLTAYHTYGKREYLDAARRGGDFIILSQLPQPQAGWAQQYDENLQPASARWFEPAACNGAVTPRNMRTLMQLYLETGEDKYLKPITAAIGWLERSRLPDGQWARFYEPGTNRPLYVNMDREVVYEFVNIRPGYSWMSTYGIPGVIERYRELMAKGRQAYLADRDRAPTRADKQERLKALNPRVREIIAALDDQGRWVTGGRITCRTFISNVETLSEYLGLVRELRGG